MQRINYKVMNVCCGKLIYLINLILKIENLILCRPPSPEVHLPTVLLLSLFLKFGRHTHKINFLLIQLIRLSFFNFVVVHFEEKNNK